MCVPFCCKTHSRRRHHSLMLDDCDTFCHASMHIKSRTSTTLIAVQADCRRPLSSPSFDTLLLSILFANLSRLVLLNILCWNSRRSYIWVPDFRQVAPLRYKLDEMWVKRVCSEQNGVEAFQKSCKLVQAFWRREHSDVVASRTFFWSTLYNWYSWWRYLLVFLKNIRAQVSVEQMVKLIWYKAASPPYMDGSVIFARWRQCAPPSNTHPKRHLYRFSRFCRGHDCDRPTDRQTTLLRRYNNSSHLRGTVMRHCCKNYG